MTRSRIGHLDRSTHQRYRDHRADAQARLGWTDISNDEFVTLLLDVFALHCEREGLEPRPSEQRREERLVADGPGHVLVRTANSRSDHHYHYPSAADADIPRCKQTRGGKVAADYQRRDPAALPERYRLCHHCDPDWQVERTGGDDMAPYRLLAEADDLDDLRADGGTVTLDAAEFERIVTMLGGVADDLHGSGLDVTACVLADLARDLEAAAGQEVTADGE